MEQTVFERMCGTYHPEDDYLLPDLEATETDQRLIARIAASEGVTEFLKRRDQMAWVWAMNNIGKSVPYFLLLCQTIQISLHYP